jgi:CRP-like cAMP-binding protein
MERLQRQWYSKKESILQQLNAEEVKRIQQHSVRIQKKRGELFWLDSEEGRKVYILDVGYLRICRTSDDGKRFITEILGPSEIFGDVVPGLMHEDLEDYAEIVRDCRIIAIESDVFHDILKNHSPMMIRLIQIIESRRRAMAKRIYSTLAKDVCARTVELLLDVGQKYGESCPDDPEVYRDVQLTHQEIADLLGVARPTISTLISDLIKRGVLIKHKSTLCLKETAALFELAEEGFKLKSSI